MAVMGRHATDATTMLGRVWEGRRWVKEGTWRRRIRGAVLTSRPGCLQSANLGIARIDIDWKQRHTTSDAYM